jgi:VCBS repeat-containing protein
MTAITQFTGTSQVLANALLAQNSGIQIVTSTVALNASSATAVGTYDGSQDPLGIGPGILLTTGTMPGMTNTSQSFGQSNNAWGNALIDQVINPVFNTASYDATTLSFSFNVTDPTATSVSFNVVFGSDEYPEWVDAFVDAGVVFVNGVNYALFNHDPMHPLSVVSQNTQAGYFQDNANGDLPIEYDGVSKVLTIVAPIIQGSINTITIGVADCGDHILDSGLFLSGLTAGTLPGSGVVIGGSDNSTTGNDTCTGSDLSDLFTMDTGDDLVFAGGGDDICSGDGGNDSLFGGSGDDALNGGSGDDDLNGGVGDDVAEYAGASTDYVINYDAVSGSYSVAATAAPVLAEGTDTLTGIETLTFSDGTFYLTQTGLSLVAPVVPPANTAGTAIISGVVATGSILTATVSDADGAPAASAIAFDWEVSFDNGASWTTTGVSGDAYTVQATDAGAQFHVIATYTDAAGGAETVTSLPKQVPAVAVNTLVVDLLNLDAPVGATTMNPLTTLVARAIELGLSPNSAEAAIKAALGIDPSVKLMSFDAYAAALADPADALALKVESIAVQVAVLTSLSNDDTGSNLALALVQANASGTVLDLADPDVLSALTGVPAVLDPVTGKYPEPLAEIFDRNVNLFEAGLLSDIEREWQDLLTIQDQIASTSIADLSVHVNQAPTGFPMGTLAGVQDQAVTIAAADLLNGLSDPEGAALAVSGLTADQPGTVSQNADGSWSFTAAPGYSGPVELSYSVVDPLGASITVTKLLIIDAAAPPVNTAPVVSGPVLVDVAEDSLTLINPLANATDVDGDQLTAPEPATLTPGFYFNPLTGEVEFDANNAAYQHLAAGETMVVTQEYLVTDSMDTTPASIQITVTGVNDAAQFAGVANGDVTEDSILTVSGSVTVADADTGQSLFQVPTAPILGYFGSVMIDATGNWTYTLDNASAAVQALPAGYTIQDTMTVYSVDGTPLIIAVNVTGADEAPVNLAPVVSGPVAAAVAEDGTTLIDPLANATDANGDALSVVLPATLTEGFSFDATTGQVTFDASGAAYQHLTAGETLVVSQAYSVTDGTDSTPASIDVTVTGTNDAAVIAGTTTGSVTEDRALLATGTLTVADVDTGEAAFVAGTLTGSYGSAILAANGAWTYTLDTHSVAVQALNAAQTLTDSLSVQSIDGTTTTLSITINGLDEAAGGPAIYGTTLANTITGTNGADVIYGLDGNDTIYGLDGNDIIDGGRGVDLIDAGAGDDRIFIGSGADGFGHTHFEGVMGESGYDTVIVDGPSTDYVVNTFQVSATIVQRTITNLNTGKFCITTGVEAVEFSDGVRVEYEAPNQAPTGTATAVLTGTEDSASTITLTDLLAGFTDSDGDILSVSGLAASAGALVDNLDGSWTLTQGADFNGPVTLSYLVSDGNGGSIAATNTLTIAAVNDAAVIAGLATGTVTEDAAVQASGTLTVADVDAGEAAFVAGTLAGTYGSATLTAGGDWTYTLDNASAAVQALAGGTAVQDTLTVTSVDGTTTSLVITVNGADEAAPTGVTLTGTGAANLLTGGAGDDTLLGLGGNDTLVGQDGNDILNGGTGADKMTGGAGDDTYHVDNKSDVVTEAAAGGTDTVLTTLTKFTLGANVEALDYLGTQDFKGTGNALDNLISGGSGVDVLTGGAGLDTLNGEQGRDELIGGLGNDILTGGAGADLFIFKTSAEAFDTVTDFAHLVDDIDLHLIDASAAKSGNQAFSFIGTAGFGLSAGQVRFDLASDGAHVQGDTNGDGIADFELFLAGVTTLTSADFIL